MSSVTKQIEELAGIMAGIDRISTANADRLLALLDQAPQEALQALVDGKVKFMWLPARRRLRSKYGVEA